MGRETSVSELERKRGKIVGATTKHECIRADACRIRCDRDLAGRRKERRNVITVDQRKIGEQDSDRIEPIDQADLPGLIQSRQQPTGFRMLADVEYLVVN